MVAEDRLWSELHDLFDTDEFGALPDVVLFDLAPGSVLAIFDFLAARSELGDQWFWHEERQADVPVAEVPDAPTLVATGRTCSFHVRLPGIEVDGVELPTLGVYVWEDSVSVDYRMGGQWTPRVLGAFARLIGALRALAPEAKVARIPDGGEVEHHADPRFGPALDRYLDEL